MRFTRGLENKVLATLRDDPDACVVFPPASYRADGSIVIIRDGLSYRMHRYLAWRLTGVKPDQRLYLLPKCDTTGCQNPHHREPSRRAGRGRTRLTCPNGHPYTAETTLPTGRDRCRICRDNRLERRRKGTQRKGYCKVGHKLTPGNSYRWVDDKGRKHKRCRTCTIERSRATRAAARLNGEPPHGTTQNTPRQAA